MNVQINQNSNYNTNQKVKFKGAAEAVTCGLNFLNTNPTIGALFVDAGSMGTPRTTLDTCLRGPAAGIETARREFGSTLNFAFMGLWALAGSALAGMFFNKKYSGAQAQKIFANGATIDAMYNLYNQNASQSKEETIRNYIKNFTSNVEMLDKKEWKNVNGRAVKGDIEKELFDVISNSTNVTSKEAKSAKEKVVSLFTAETGANQNARLKVGDKVVEQSLENFVDSFVALGKTFKDSTDGKISPEFIKSLKRNKLTASFLGLAIPLTVAVTLQPINSWITKKQTGQEGFVGVEGGQIDKSTAFKLKKTAAAGLYGAGALATIGKGVLNKIQFTGLIPNISQFKFIYGFTIFSRFLASRDGNELRETCVKDSLGFLNWLILGGVVSKLVANAMNKDIINYDDSSVKNAGKFKKNWHWLTNASIKSAKEVLLSDMKQAGLSITDKDGKIKSFKQLLLDLPKDMELTRKKIKTINRAQLAGYAYSMLALGCGITLFNTLVTNYVVKNKKKNKQQSSPELSATNLSTVNPYFIADVTVKKINSDQKVEQSASSNMMAV